MDKPEPSPFSIQNQEGAGSHHISAPNITVSIGGSGVKAIIGILATVAILLVLTVPVAKSADWKSDRTALDMDKLERRVDDRLKAYGTKVELLNLWAQRASIACEAQGVKLPPLPQ